MLARAIRMRDLMREHGPASSRSSIHGSSCAIRRSWDSTQPRRATIFPPFEPVDAFRGCAGAGDAVRSARDRSAFRNQLPWDLFRRIEEGALPIGALEPLYDEK